MKEGEIGFHQKAGSWASHQKAYWVYRSALKNLTSDHPEYAKLRRIKEIHGEAVNILTRDGKKVNPDINSSPHHD